MIVELFPFQKRACVALRGEVSDALYSYQRRGVPQVISFTAPTGAGKTIIMASLIESIFCGDGDYIDQPEAIFVWLSDSPQLNEQSKIKIETKADRIKIGQCVTIQDDSFDKEILDDGHIYFLNTQKLGKSSNLTKKGDARTYTIWETLANTISEKSDRLYFIIDEAHRGAQGNEAARATTIMQKFIKGSQDDKLKPMPVVIGMSATSTRFNNLVTGVGTSTIRNCVVTADEVRSSGLLKDRIVITCPDDKSIGNEMAILQAAADDWKEKWDHWGQYCREQHHSYVNPVFVVQVMNGKGQNISETNLDDCLSKIEERTGFKFENGEVVHTFGQTTASITINGLDVRYVEPSQIADDRNIKVVFFKENLSTGWDCPRAETMMSFRHAVDSTYIAQLLGRMVRTPIQMHIQVDDILNDVHLYLPHFDMNTVRDIVRELQDSEGGDIPTEVTSEDTSNPSYETWTTGYTQEKEKESQQVTQTQEAQPQSEEQNESSSSTPQTDFGQNESSSSTPQTDFGQNEELQGQQSSSESHTSDIAPSEATTIDEQSQEQIVENTPQPQSEQRPTQLESPQNESVTSATPTPFDRDEVLKYINESGLLTYEVRSVKISNYLSSLFKLAHLLVQSGLFTSATTDVHNDIAKMINDYVMQLKTNGKYNELSEQVKKFELSTQIFDAFGQSVDKNSVHNTIMSTDLDLERQFRTAESKLGNDGVGISYINTYCENIIPNESMIDVILFTSDTDCKEKLDNYAKEKFHSLNDIYRRQFAKISSEKIRKQYDDIVSDGDIVSSHNFRIPEIVQAKYNKEGKAYDDHLLINPTTGTATIALNSWEEATLNEEQKRKDFVCWLRNPSRGSWALCIPYDYGGVKKPAYPDLIIVRKADNGYIIDILEPHMPKLDDNLGKAKGFAEYARQNPGVGRIQLIREGRDAAGRSIMKRLDMSLSAVRDKVSNIMTPEELNRLFDSDGFSDGVV